MRLWRVRHKPLRAARVFAGQGHSHRRSFERGFVYLTTNLIARPTILIAARVTGLDHKIRHNARNSLPVEKAFARKLNKIVHRQRRVGRKKLNRKRAFRGGDYYRGPSADTADSAAIISVTVACFHNSDAI